MGLQGSESPSAGTKLTLNHMESFSLSSQMLLPVHMSSDASFDNFYCERNAKAKFLLASYLDDLQETALILSGPSGVGKSHLLSAATAYSERKGAHQSCYFSLAELNAFDLPENDLKVLFGSFEPYTMLALDHVDEWLLNDPETRSFKELCLFNLFNHYKMSQKVLVLSFQASLDQLDFVLPDLLSRLRSGLFIKLSAYTDAEKELILQHVAIKKGFSLEDGVSAYIIKRSGRDLSHLIKLLDVLDKASLTEQRKLTIPFVKKVLDW
jgi:DnaA-homolog protein